MTVRPEVCVGAIVFDRDGRLLLIERGRGQGVGQWSVPGGRVEPGERLADAVVREVAEETGLAVRCGRFVGWVERLGEDHHFVIMDFLADRLDDVEPTAGDDAAAVRFVPLDRLDSLPLVDGLRDFLATHELAP